MSGAWTDDIPPYLVVGTPGGARIEIGPGDVIKIFNSSNFLVAELSDAGLQVFGVDGSQVAVFAGAVSEITIEPAGGNANPAIIAGGIAGGGNPQLILESPQQTLTSPNTRSSILLQGANAALPQSSINIAADAVQMTGAAGTSGVGAAVLNMGNNQGSPAGINLGVSGGSAVAMDGGGLSIANNITISTGTIDLSTTAINLNFNGRAYLLTATDNFDCSATQAVGGAFVAIPGMTHSYLNLSAGAKWEATVTCDTQLNATAGNVMHSQLVVGGVVQANTLDQGPRPSTSDTGSRTWSGTFVAGGTLSFAVNSQITGGGGVGNNILIGASTLHVNIYQ